jgi:hypothetical protein
MVQITQPLAVKRYQGLIGVEECRLKPSRGQCRRGWAMLAGLSM